MEMEEIGYLNFYFHKNIQGTFCGILLMSLLCPFYVLDVFFKVTEYLFALAIIFMQLS